MKAIILARVSTKEQEEGHSIAAQRQRLADYCARKGLTVIRVFELVESFTRGERKEFVAMLEFAKAQNETMSGVVGRGWFVTTYQLYSHYTAVMRDCVRESGLYEPSLPYSRTSLRR
jgi:hypothetical protein